MTNIKNVSTVNKTGRTSGALRRNTKSAAALPCRMSASPASSGNDNEEESDDTARPAAAADADAPAAASNNPFLVAAVGMALLSSDPAATLAAQSARDAVFPGGGAPAPPVLMLSAATVGDPGLKDLLGEVIYIPKYIYIYLFCVCASRALWLGGGRVEPVGSLDAKYSVQT